MKKILIIPALLIAISFYSCKKDAASVNEKTTLSQQTGEDLVAREGTTIFASCDKWYIELFRENGTDFTTTYGNYQFVFCPDNTVTVSNDVLSFSGTWHFYVAKGGSTSYLQLDFNSYGNPTSRGEDLQGMWAITEMSENEIALQSSDGLNQLVFMKHFK